MRCRGSLCDPLLSCPFIFYIHIPFTVHSYSLRCVFISFRMLFICIHFLSLSFQCLFIFLSLCISVFTFCIHFLSCSFHVAFISFHVVFISCHFALISYHISFMLHVFPCNMLPEAFDNTFWWCLTTHFGRHSKFVTCLQMSAGFWGFLPPSGPTSKF